MPTGQRAYRIKLSEERCIMYSNIIHLTDLSKAALPALQAAQELAKRLGSHLHVCYVAHPPLVTSGETLVDPKSGETRDIPAELEAAVNRDPAVERELHFLLVERSAGVKEVLKALPPLDAGLLVVGMHKKTGLAGFLGGSFTEEIVREAGCPVLVVK